MYNHTRVDGASLLEEVAIAANLADQPAEALATALKLICCRADWDIGHAWTVTAGELVSAGIWYCAAPSPTSRLAHFQSAAAVYHIQPGEGLLGEALADGYPRWIADLGQCHQHQWQRAAHAAGFSACLIFPVRSGTHTVGVLECYARTPRRREPQLLAALGQLELQLGQVFARCAAQNAMRRARDQVHNILDQAADAFIAMDQDGRVTDWSQAASALFGWSRSEVLGRIATETIVPPAFRHEHQQGLIDFFRTDISEVQSPLLEISGLKKDGSVFPLELTHWSIKEDGKWQFYALVRDISARKTVERKLESRAFYDPLTGLANRALVMDRLTHFLRERGRRDDPLTVLFVDLDHFKRINDSLGHDAGDHVLIAIAERFLEAVRPGDTVARLGGDEFLVMCPGVGSEAEAVTIAKRILAGLAEPVRIKGDSVFLCASIGIALAEPEADADTVVAAADMAMYHAKRAGRAGYAVFDSKMREVATARLRTENDLRQALIGNQLKLYFQPIVDLTDHHIAAVEALMRWEHPTRGLLLPAEFIPIAEDTGLIVPIGAWAIREACRILQQWGHNAALQAPLCLSVNLSARQLAQSDLVSMIERTLAEASIDPRHVEFGIEVTETLAMRDLMASTKILQALRERGVRLSIDDFGTGYSSLAYLSHLPADTLKIDMSFVQRAADDSVNRAIVHTIASLGNSLGLKVIAEGVETLEQEAALREAGVKLVQGFLYARPEPADTLLARLTGDQRAR